MRLGLDVMGGDFAPDVAIEGAISAAKELSHDIRIVLFGPQQIIEEKCEENNVRPGDFDIIHAPDVIGMDESPIKAFSTKPQSSIAVGFRMLKAKKIDSFASAGSTGAMFIGTMNSVDRIPGIIRPCISTIIPREDGQNNLLLDVGLNPDSRADVMYQFAILGNIYAKSVLKIAEPKIGLLNIGEEEKKGSILAQSAYQLMKESTEFNFIGNIEGIELFQDKANVIVTDGFTGNIVLKQLEAVMSIVQKRGFKDSYIETFNYENFGGTPILGANAPVLIGHGKSSALAIKNMVLTSKEMVESNLVKNFRKAFTYNIF
ncbi:MAG: phosphate acyltransferase PlsX [Bacteroidales bacterium]|jgi:glycerol-3-phosphate acyltransferase PlsX|nr:phosphate acyltransferase PlsX [Bacteroidales bacterium]